MLALHLPVTGALTRKAVFQGAGYPSNPALDEAFEEQLDRDGKLDTTWDRVERELAALPVELYGGGYVSRRAWNLHQTFKWSVIASLGEDAEHVLSAQQVSDWITQQG